MQKLMSYKETFAKLHNEYLERAARNRVNIAYYARVASNFKTNTPEYKSNMETVKVNEDNLFYNEMTVRVTKRLYEQEK